MLHLYTQLPINCTHIIDVVVDEAFIGDLDIESFAQYFGNRVFLVMPGCQVSEVMVELCSAGDIASTTNGPNRRKLNRSLKKIIGLMF